MKSAWIATALLSYGCVKSENSITGLRMRLVSHTSHEVLLRIRDQQALLLRKREETYALHLCDHYC